MNLAVYMKSLSDSRGLAGWALGTAAVGMMYASTYPSQKGNTASLPEALRESLHIDATAAGYLQASVFGLILPLLVMIYGAVTGSRAMPARRSPGSSTSSSPTPSPAPGSSSSDSARWSPGPGPCPCWSGSPCSPSATAPNSRASPRANCSPSA